MIRPCQPERQASGNSSSAPPTCPGRPERREEAFMGIVAIDPETGKWRTIYKGASDGPISPDGRYMAYPNIGQNLAASQTGVWIHDLTGQTQKQRIFARRGYPLWSHNGQKVVIGAAGGESAGKVRNLARQSRWHRLNQLPIPETEFVLDCSRDGIGWLRGIKEATEASRRLDAVSSRWHRRLDRSHRFGQETKSSAH